MSDVVSQLRVVVDADTAAAEKGLRDLGQQVSSFGDSFKQGLGIGAGFTAIQAGLSALGGSFGALKSSVIDFNQQLDQSRAVFTRYFNGNQQVADQFLNTLKGFAATTPFEFKDLSQLAIKLQNANTNANDIIPTIKAIGNAASASGSLSKDSIDKITLALTQMQMKGKVSGEEMLQLVENGVPAWQILAEATGKPIPVLQEMASKGQITADVFVNGFRKMYENAGLMEGASKSLEGALSTVRDVGTQAFADIGRSVYDLATQGANALAGFLSTEQFQTWVQAARLGMDAVVQGVRDLIAWFQPLGETIKIVFEQMTAGDFAGAFGTIGNTIQSALSGALEAVQAFGQQMFGAGASLIGEFAGGILDGAGQALAAAIDVVTSTIAAFLIGQSPPPEGPLARIREGGAATIAAWGEGAASAAEKAVKPAADAIKGNLDELKLAGRDADAAIREIGRAIQDVESASRDLKYTADDIKTAYNDQISIIDDQIKALQGARDTQRDREKLELNLEEIQLRQAEIAALGDKQLAGEIKQKLEALKLSTQERKNREALQDAEKALAGSEKDRLKAKLDAQKLDQQEADLKKRLKDAKGDDKKRIQQQLQELDLRRKIEAAEAKEREEANQRRLADAQAKRDELTLQAELNGLVDKEALGAINARRDAINLRKEELSLAEQTEKIQREIALAPLKEEREALIAQRDAMLRPLQEQLETLGRQKASLSEQRREMQGYKSEISAATAGLRDQAAAMKDAEKAAKEAAQNRPTPGVDKSFTPDAAAEAAINKAKESGAKLATAIRDGFVGMFANLVPPAITEGMNALGQKLSGEGIPGIVAVVGNGISAAVPVLASKLAGWYDAFLDWAHETQTKLLAAINPIVTGVLDWIGQNARPIADKLAAWGVALLDWAIGSGPKLLDKVAAIGGDLLLWVGQQAIRLAGKLAEWGTAFVAWVGPKIPVLLGKLGELGAKAVEWIAGKAGEWIDALGAWGLAFVEWVGPKIPPLLAELGKLLGEMTAWIVSDAVPKLTLKLLEWGKAFISWVAPRIPELVIELGKLLAKFVWWGATEALPAINKQLLEWGLRFVKWVPEALPPFLRELEGYGKELLLWMFGMHPSIHEKLKEWANRFLDWIRADVLPYLDAKLDAFRDKVTGWIDKAIPGLTTYAAHIGNAILDGIWDAAAWVTTLPKKLGELLTQTTTWVDDRVKSFTTEAGKIGDALIAGIWDAAAWTTTLPTMLGELLTNVGKWIADQCSPSNPDGFLSQAKSVGWAMLEGIAGGFTATEKVNEFKGWLKTRFVDQLPEWLKDMLDIHSPSGLMKPIGEALIDGIIAGMQDKVPMLKKVIDGIRGFMPGGIDVPTGEWADRVRKAGDAGGLDGRILAKQLAVESINFDPDVIAGRRLSPAGARGIAQFMPGTAAMVARQIGVSLDEFWGSPMLQIQGAVRHMSDLLDMFGGDWKAALVGYNAGPGNAQRWLRNGGSLDWLADEIPESRLYLKKILGLAQGGIVPATPGGVLARIGEGGRDEAVIPLPPGWSSGGSHIGPMVTHRYVIQDPSGRVLEEWYVEGRERARRRGRDPVGAP